MWLFQRVVAVVCHAGSGTIASAFNAGVPVLCLPFLFDQFYFAEQMCWLGIGTQLSVRDLIRNHSAQSSNQIDEALRIVLSESAR
jgi:UDP:flavonoid glycosyltransferase YjiC (YdhE family)